MILFTRPINKGLHVRVVRTNEDIPENCTSADRLVPISTSIEKRHDLSNPAQLIYLAKTLKGYPLNINEWRK